MNPKAPEMSPPNIYPVVAVDPVPWWSWIAFIILIVAVVVLVWAVWTGFKCRVDVKQFEIRKRKLIFWATALLFAGTVDCLYNVATAFFVLAQPPITEIRFHSFSIAMAEFLYHCTFFVAVSGIMFLVSLTMPWRRKDKDNTDAMPSQESER